MRVEFETDGGPWVRHNMPCAVAWDAAKAVFDMDQQIFKPSWQAQDEGWMLVRATGGRAALVRWLTKAQS